MPKVYTYNAEFNPISFADRIAPMRLYKEEYDKQQAAYEKMLEETDDLGVLKDIAMDADSYGIYKSFQDEINSIGEEMETKGLSNDVRNRLLKLRRRQADEINPLLERQKSRADLIKEQRKYLETHPNAIFDIDYDSVPLSKITSSSTYKPYDLGKDYASIADTIYSNIMSNNGTDTTDYNEIKSQYNYDNLSPLKQKQVDDVINLAKNKAAATYQIYKDREAMDLYRYRNKGTKSNSTTTQAPQSQVMSYADMLDINNKKTYSADINGNSVDIATSASGQKTLKDYKGQSKVVNVPSPKENESKEDYNKRAYDAITKAYYNGYNLAGPIKTNRGENITVLTDDSGKTYIIDNKKNIKPISNINSFRELATVYRDKPVNYENGVSSTISTNGEEYEKKADDTLNTSEPVSVYRTLANVDDDLTNFLMMNDIEDASELFNDGFSVYKYSIKNKRGTTVAYRYVIKSNNSQDNSQRQTQSPQTNQNQNNDIVVRDINIE